MARYIGCLLLQRVLYALILTFCVFFRPVAIAIPYLILLFCLPLVPIASPKTIPGRTAIYFKFAIAIGVINVLLQIAFQVVLAALTTDILPQCEFLELLMRHIGMIRFYDFPNDFILMFLWYLPDVLMLLSTIIIFIILKRMTRGSIDLEAADTDSKQKDNILQVPDDELSYETYIVLLRLGTFIATLTLLLAATIRPSIPGSVYFLVFIIAGTWWACFKELEIKFAIVCRFLLVFLAIHLTAFLCYQTPWPQEMFPSNSTVTRFLGFDPLLISYCNSTEQDIRTVHFNTDLTIDCYLNPYVILLTYYLLAIISRFILDKALMRSSMKKLKTFKQLYSKRGDSSTGDPGSMQMNEMNQDDQKGKTSLWQHFWFGFGQFSSTLFKNSYILSNIIMMVWSIVYHSWLTFIFLLFANILWTIPNQRKNMLRCSPFVVLYGEFLLISQYIYGINLTEDELPSTLKGINMAQIGFVRYEYYPCLPLLLKSAFTMIFWITLRQMCFESKLQKQSSTLAHLAAPFQVTVTTATSALGSPVQDNKSKLIMDAGKFIKSLLLHMWVWIVALALFLGGIYGQRMTGIRIAYMGLFLMFLILFQLSWRVWKKLMYSFWVVVIGFAMITLILIYSYQFDRFDEYWEVYIGIPLDLQRDIGLEKYHTKDLFLHLANHTLVVIITVVQLQIFHKKYIEMLDLPLTERRPTYSDPKQSENSDVVYENLQPESITEEPQTRSKSFSISNVRRMSSKKVASWFSKCKDYVFDLMDIFLLVLEIHLIKVILILAFYLAIDEISAMHTVVAVLAILAVVTRSHVQLVLSRIISVVVAILLLLKMIYQIQYINHSMNDVFCVNSNNTTINTNITNDPTKNDASWFGFNKLTGDETLFTIIKGYLGYILISTINTIVTLRQKRSRFLNGKPMTRPRVIFPTITRENADDGMWNMIRYLINYMFYKFGIEISLIAIVALIGMRMDVVALIYAFWLCTLFAISRQTQEKIWPLLMWFAFILILLQYLVLVNAPPSLCWDIEWIGWMKNLQEWDWLPDISLRNQAKKLMTDFILIMIIARQMLVFLIERKYKNTFPGGSNESVVDDISTLDKDAIPDANDFVSRTKNWLDIAKCIIFLGFFWAALAIVFMTGSNRTNIFAIGYLLGSFIFFWQGAEFYIRPIYSILKMWRWLIAYNIFVITAKALLQIPGCIFIQQLGGVCWIVQLLGIRCIRKFYDDFGSDVLQNCEVPSEDIGLVWDGICFAFLIFQLRMFQSHYFCYVIIESKASVILASRGAELIEALRKKQVKLQAHREEQILHKIKKKMDRIKANQQKLQPVITNPKHHHADVEYRDSQRDKTKVKHRNSHPYAVRSGDYYLFDDIDNKVELDLIHARATGTVEDDIVLKRTKEDKIAVDKQLEKRLKKRRSSRRKSLPAGRESSIDPRSTLSEPIQTVEPQRTDGDSDDNDEFTQPDGEQPSTSRGRSDRSPSKDESTTSKDTDAGGVSSLDFIITFCKSLLVTLTMKFYKWSLNYRYVTRILAQEKKSLKLQSDFRQGHSLASAPIPSALRSRGDESRRSSLSSTTQQIDSISDSHLASAELPNDSTTIAQLLRQNVFSMVKDPITPEDKLPKEITELEDDFLLQKHSIFLELLKSLWFAIISNTDLVCYIMVFTNMVASASLLALPMPIMVFLWGTLTVPRPSKTFWVTLIAYTEIVVLIKCFSQFEILWWNSDVIPSTNPLAAARIIGVERKTNYAHYDLALLLIIFCHRFMQKQMGIWRTIKDDENDLDGLYVAQTGDKARTDLDVQTAIIKQGELSLTLTKLDNNQHVPSDGEIVNVTKFIEHPNNYFPSVAVMSTKKYCSSVKLFFQKLRKTSNRVTADLYTYIFLCDFINFFVLLFGFTAFGSTQGDGGVASYLEENKIPVPFLVMLLLQFVFIIVDRALYLRKNLMGKIIFQFITVIVMHVWLFFLVPIFTERSFNKKIPPIMYYIIKCFYFLFSAYQIRCGYPRRILGNCLTKGFSVVNLTAFKVYMLTPFLFELRTLMDWIWTDTSMPLFEWLRMEDIFANIYEIKCTRQLENDLPAQRGVAKGYIIKYVMGGGFLFAIIALVWGPLALFALGNTVGKPNNPYEVTVELKIGPYEPVYRMSAQSSQIHPFREENWAALQKLYSKDRVALTFLSNYEHVDVAAVILGPNSTALWIISPPDLERLKYDLRNNVTLRVRYKYSVSRITYNEKMAGTISDEPSYELTADDPARSGLVAMLDGNSTTERVELLHLFPKFLKVKNLGDLKPITQLLPGTSEIYRDISLLLHQSPNSADMFWEVLEVCSDKVYKEKLGLIPYADCTKNLVLYTFSDKLFPATLSWLTAGGVIGIYTTFVFLASRFFRGLFLGGSQNIMYTELPYVDRILQLCLDIYLVRESMEFSLEEDLFAKLIFLYRSPETMIKWTRPAEEQSDDEDETSHDHNDDTENDNSINAAAAAAAPLPTKET